MREKTNHWLNSSRKSLLLLMKVFHISEPEVNWRMAFYIRGIEGIRPKHPQRKSSYKYPECLYSGHSSQLHRNQDDQWRDPPQQSITSPNDKVPFSWLRGCPLQWETTFLETLLSHSPGTEFPFREQCLAKVFFKIEIDGTPIGKMVF